MNKIFWFLTEILHAQHAYFKKIFLKFDWKLKMEPKTCTMIFERSKLLLETNEKGLRAYL